MRIYAQIETPVKISVVDRLRETSQEDGFDVGTLRKEIESQTDCINKGIYENLCCHLAKHPSGMAPYVATLISKVALYGAISTTVSILSSVLGAACGAGCILSE